jgi:hypothetical protein
MYLNILQNRLQDIFALFAQKDLMIDIKRFDCTFNLRHGIAFLVDGLPQLRQSLCATSNDFIMTVAFSNCVK